MSRYAEDDDNFKIAIENAIIWKLQAAPLTRPEITEASFTADEKMEIFDVFTQCMKSGDVGEIHSRIATFSFDEFNAAHKAWANQCFETELDNQLNLMRCDDEPTADDIGAREL